MFSIYQLAQFAGRLMHTMSVILDHLALGRGSAAADVCAQRLKALELATVTGSWEKAQYVEIVETEGPTLIGKAEEFMVTKEVELHQRLRGRGADRTYEHYWKQPDGGKGKSKDKGKGKENGGKGKGNARQPCSRA